MRACGTNDVRYLSYNDDAGDGSYPFAHYPSLACPDPDHGVTPFQPCQLKLASPDTDVTVDLGKFEAILREGFALLKWGPRVVYSPFAQDFPALGILPVRES